MTVRRQPRRKSAKQSSRRLDHETLERRELLAAAIGASMDESPRLISVSANSGEQFDLNDNNVLSTPPTELTFRFGGDLIDESTLAGIQFRRSGGDGSFSENNEQIVTPGFLGFAQNNGTNIIVARFAEALPDDQYVIGFAGFDDTNAGIVSLRDVDGDLFRAEDPSDPVRPIQEVRFEIEVGPQVVGVVPQPVETISGVRIQRRDQVWVFFNEDPLSNPSAGPVSFLGGSTLPVVNPDFYKLIFTNDTVENTDDPLPIPPNNVEYNPALNRAVLTFDLDLAELAPAAMNGNSGTYRLRIGSGNALPAPPTILPSGGGGGDTFDQAVPLGVSFDAGTQSVVVTQGLIESNNPIIPNWPGAADAAGLRHQRRDVQLTSRIDTNPGINVFPYNFATLYGEDPQGNLVENAITEAQKQRVRQVLELYSERLGVSFIETERDGLQIVTGDPRAIVITADSGAGTDTPLSIYRVNDRDPSKGLLILDAGENWYDGYGLSPDSRSSYFVEAVRGIGNLLGIGNLFELPEGVGAGGSSPDEPNAVTFSEQFYPNLPVEPEFLSQSDITLGQALHRPEGNDVDFYSFTATDRGRLSAEAIAERLDGSSLLDTNLQLYRMNGPDDFQLIARNDDFYSDDSFIGIDIEAGDYFLGLSSSGNDQYNGQVSESGLGGTSEGRYELRVTFKAFDGATITDTTGSELDGDADGQEGGDFNFWFRVARDRSTATTGQPRTIFVDKLGDDLNLGSLGAPLRTIKAAFAMAQPGDLVRLLPNGGVDGLITTQDDNQPYEIGLGGSPLAPLPDGAVFEIPQGVTVMIDAGAILKLRTAKISVGSESQDEDRSLAALQVLGTPVISEANGVVTGSGEVIFTSYDNSQIGVDNNSSSALPLPGNWGGIEFRNDFDRSEGRPVWETEGIFLDYVSHANMSYGGGAIDVTEPTVTPIQMLESRPTLIYNTITNSADAAISADPNSFRETNFHAPLFQRAATFTSDYERVGPELTGNRLINNSINGLFIRVNTPAAGQLEPMTVSGRWDDTDVVHVLSQVLVLQGTPGGPILLEERPDVLSVQLTPTSGGTLAAMQQYDYKVTFVNAAGSESLASLPTAPIVASSGRAVDLINLPIAPLEFVGRRLYRSVPGSTDYEFVTQLDRATTSYYDDGTTRGGLLRGEEKPDSAAITLSDGVPTGTLTVSAVLDYRITFVDSFGGESRASDPTVMAVVSGSGSITLDNLPVPPADFVAKRIYRLDPVTNDYQLVVELDADEISYLDDGRQIGGLLSNDGDDGALLLPRFDARLSVDAGVITKLQNSRIQAGFGSDFYAEGVDGSEVVFTSRLDDTYGAGGTFDTNNDGISDNAAPGDWGGLIFRQDATGSLDFADVRFGGGATPTQGSFTEFNAIEILQADVRIANSTIHDNASGFVDNSIREGVGFNGPAAIFVRGAQPIIVDNIIELNVGAAISINPDALDFHDRLDVGRSTGPIELIDTDRDNQGPLISGNRLDGNVVNGMRVRSELLTTESVWDDTDIVHVVDGEITSATHHFKSGLRLKSDPEQSLVVKFGVDGELVGGGIPLDIEDRIGGTLQVLGTPGNPVVLTSINDCTVGAGFTPDGRPMNDTLLSNACTFTEEVTTQTEYVDVVVVMDESISMGSTQQFSAQFIQDLEAGLLASGIGVSDVNRYGAVGFGGFTTGNVDNEGRSLMVGGGLFGSAADYAAATSQFVTSGFSEDGYGGIDFALQNYTFRPEAAKFIILATDEPRSDNNASLTLASTIASLQSAGINLQGILDVDIRDNSNQAALAIDNDLVYTETGTTFSAAPGGSVIGGRSVADYLPLVQATNGIAGDLSQIGRSTQTANVFSQALVSSLVVQAGGTSGTAGAAGDWQGLVIETFANDRNVAHVIETEKAISATNASNALADDAQLIGDLAAHEYAGDETERLGFNIRGTLADPSDLDVYKFTATGGTTVYIDIDDTSFGLDTVIELIDVNDNVLASSDNSFDEATDPATLISNLPPSTVRPLFNLGQGNIEGPNALDAGMRVDLPGSANSENVYFVRVRSAAGITDGQYTLSIRLRETDEVAGSTIQFADIRYATDAITVSGAPLHSPLTGDAQEALNFSTIIDPTPNNPQSGDEFIQEADNNRLSFTRAQADQLGNLLTTDRASLVVTGDIGNINSIDADVRLEDVDVYQIDLYTQQIEPDVFDNENRFSTLTFDVDYADGLGRPNTSLAVYDSGGELILHNRDSNIADDVGRPLEGVDSEDLQGGSVGVLDAHIGPVELREGTYFVVVSNASVVPGALDQFFNPNSSNPNVRLMPINSVRRIADDTLDEYDIEDYDPENSFDFFSDAENYTAERPIIEPVFDQHSIVPYTLDDLRLFVSIDGAISGNNNTVLASFNPFTGTMERLIGQSAQPTDDLALRSDGELFTYSLGPATGPENAGNVGNLLNLSPVDGSATQTGDDALAFTRNNQAGADLEADPNAQLDIHAITFPLSSGSTVRTNPINANNRGYVVGSRDNFGRGEILDVLRRNLFYEFTVGNGAMTSRGSTNANAHRTFPGTVPYRPSDGPASIDREYGVVDTGNIFNSGGDGGDITGIGIDPSNFGNFFAVTDQGGVHSFDPNDTVPAPASSVAFGYQSVIPTVFHGVVPIDPAHAASSFDTVPEFSGMAMGPRTIEDGAYSQMIFATTRDGWLYALEIDAGQQVQPASVFYGGRSAIPLTFQSGQGVTRFFSDEITGLAFSHLEESPWHQTFDRGAQTQHGIEIPEDQSRVGVLGSGSLYYGFEVSGNANDNTIARADNDNRGELAPGGSHGSVISRPFNLEGYSAADKPTLYFTYLMEVESDSSNNDPDDDYDPIGSDARNQNDSFRVFGSGDDGEWKLLATNDGFRELPFDDEYDYFNQTNIPVQELFDDQNEWRQARVDISPLAGSENVRIRFDFSTAGSMRTQFGSIDFTAVPGDEVVDHQLISFQDSERNDVTFESVVGRDVTFPSGLRLQDGDSFSVTGPEGVFTVRFVPGLPAAPNEVSFNPAMLPADVADAVMAVLPGSLNPRNNGDGSISLLAASEVTVIGDIPVGQSNPVQVQVFETPDQFINVPPFFIPGTPAATQMIVPSGANLAPGESVTIVGSTTVTTLTYVNIGTGSPGEIVFSPSDSVDIIAERVMAQLPDELGAVYEGNGIITFINEVTVNVSPSTTSIGIDTFYSVDEGRIMIRPANGDNLINGETLTFTSSFGTTTVTFIDSALPGGPGIVTFQGGDNVATITQRLFDALPIELSPFINGTRVSVAASSVTSDVPGTNIDLGPAPSRRIDVPAGNVLENGDVLTIVTEAGTTEITFLESPVLPSPAGTVHFQDTDTQAVIQSRLLAALPSTMNVGVVGSSLIVYGAIKASTSLPFSPIGISYEDGQKVVVPAGSQLTDGETLDIRVGGLTTTVTFVDIDVSTSGGPFDVDYQTGDTATDIASRLQIVLSGFTSVVDSLASNTVLFAADSVAHGASNTASQVTAGPYTDFLLNLDIPDGNQLRTGEQITIFGPTTEVITFIQAGSTVLDYGTIPIVFDVTDTAQDLYPRILSALSTNFQAYIDPCGNGLNFGNAFFAFISNDPVSTDVTMRDVDEFAIPITIPNGDEIRVGETLVITQKNDLFGTNSQVFTLVDTANATGAIGELVFDPLDSAADVTADLLDQLPLSLQAYLVGTREIYLLNATSVVTEPDSLFVSFESIQGTTPILVDSTMDTVQVTARLRSNFAEGFGRWATNDGSSNATADNFKVYGQDRIRLFNAATIDSGPFGVSGYALFSGGTFTTSPVPADEFGENQPSFISTGSIRTQGARNNEVEGVYIDDIIIGFAERGEMVFNASPGDTSFTFNPETLPDTHPLAIQPERQNEALLGGYTLEVRTSDEYGVEQDYDPINLELGEDSSLGRSFDTNDRLVDGAVTLIAQPGWSLLDGDTFTLSDGRREMTFEFDDVNDDSVAPGNVRVPFDPATSDAAFVAREIRNAINSPQVQGVLGITAATSDSFESAEPSGNRVELFSRPLIIDSGQQTLQFFGDEILVNPTGGRFLKIDLVAEETFQGRETSKQIPITDQDAESVVDSILADELARSTVTGYFDGTVDTLVAVGKIGDAVNTGTGINNLQDGAVVLGSNPEFDWDSVRIYLNAGQTIEIDVDTAGFTKHAEVLDLPVISVFEQGDILAIDSTEPTSTPLMQSSLFTPTAAPGETELGAFMQFTPLQSGFYDIVISGATMWGGSFDFTPDFGEYQLTIRPESSTSAAVPDRDVVMTDYHFGKGDVNRVQDQGQLLISSNFITNSAGNGIVATSAPRGQTLVNNTYAPSNALFTPGSGDLSPSAMPSPGSARLLRNQNTDALIPAAVISNNVVADSGDAAILFAGDLNVNGQIASPNLFGRILNNTVVGDGSGEGIRVSGAASPTILNNIIAGFNNGVITSASQFGDVIVGANAYQDNTNNSSLGLATSSFVVPTGVPLFQDPTRNVFIPAAGSNVIDSSFASLPERIEFYETIKEPAGISPSPIIAPEFDAYGQARVDDPLVATPGGVGLNVFIDRGAIDRADDDPPVALLTEPQDAVDIPVQGGDQDVDLSFVRLREGVVEFFEVQLVDVAGTGPDPDTINSRNVTLTENGRQLIPDSDYVFGYSANSRTIRLTPLTGLWRPDAVYEITLNNRQRIELSLPAGDQIADGDQVVIDQPNSVPSIFEFDSGFSLVVPQTTILTVTGTNADLQEQDTLTITSASDPLLSRTLEIDSDGNFDPTNIPVNVATAGTILEVRDAILAALNSVDPTLGPLTVAEVLELAPVAVGSSQLQLGTLATHAIGGGFTSVDQAGQLGGVMDGDVFSYTSAIGMTTFELTTDATLTDTSFTPIPFSRTDTPDQIAEAIAFALSNDSDLGLPGTQSVGGGTVAVGGVVGDDLMLVQTALQLQGAPGLATPNAIGIPFLPTAQFTPTATAASLQTAIRDANLPLETFSLGDGKLLVSGAQQVQASFGGTLADVGVTLPAVADLAGNPVRETRINLETRFTIIMPQVKFDYGDAPESYGTLELDNGARHTVSDDRLPRLGAYLDTEANGQPNPTFSDDTAVALLASGMGNVFTVGFPAANTVEVTVEPVAPSGGETLALSVDGNLTTFELVLATSNPDIGNVPITFVNGEAPDSIAAKLVSAIRARIPQVDEGVILSVDPGGTVITLEAIDDEDGVSIGTFVDVNGNPFQVFTVPGTDPANVTASDVLGFLNPRDPGGSTMAVNVQGSGLLDVWVDFDLNGRFESDEQVTRNQPVVDGTNLITVFPQANALEGDTWMRVRVSSSGDALPTGVSVGGEVEDYLVSVLPIDLPTAVDDPRVDRPDAYTIAEDATLVVDDPAIALFQNDPGVNSQILPVRYFVGQQPQNGTLVVTDELSGFFNYQPDPDFYGTDTFTYRLSTQQNAGPTALAQAQFATVTITVEPRNDDPGAEDQTIFGVEDTLLEIDAAELLRGATGHGDPAIPNPPFDESNQDLNVISITAGGLRISATNPTAAATTPQFGTLTAEFDSSTGFITKVFYDPAENFNSDNLPLPDGSSLLDEFEFEIQDDGILISPSGAPIAGTPLTDTATAFLQISPLNDDPAPATDLASIADTQYQDYFNNLSLQIPVPTEDTPITIPGNFLLGNDVSGPSNAQDEVQSIRGNDGPLSIVDVALVDPETGTIELLPGGDVLITPAADIYGDVLFTYTVEDVGIDEAIDGTRVLNPLQSTVTSTVFLEPVNDAPIAYDRFLEVDEVVEPSAPAVLNFTANDLILGSGVNLSSPISVTSTSITLPDASSLIEGETLTIIDADNLERIVEFSKSNTPSAGTDILVTYVDGESGSTLALRLQNQLRAVGGGGTANGDTVSFLNVVGLSSNPIQPTIIADPIGVQLLDGSTIVGGETVMTVDGFGASIVFEFSKSGFSLSGGDVLVPISDSDDAMTVASAFQTALINNGIGAVAAPGVGAEWNVRFLEILSYNIDDPASQIMSAGSTVTMTDGINMIDEETITIDDGSGFNKVVEFNTSGIASPGTDFVVQYDVNDLADQIAANLVAVLRSNNYGAVADVDEVTFTLVTNATSAPPVTSIVASPQSIVFPAGSGLIDGETLDMVLANGSTIVIEFNTSGLPAAGTDIVVPYTAFDSASAVASRVENILRGAGIAATVNGDTVDFQNVTGIVVGETPAAAGLFAENLGVPFNESEQRLRIVAFQTSTGVVVDADIDNDGVFTLPTAVGGELTVEFIGGAFTTGSYAPPVDYNERQPFIPKDFFTFTIEDDGRTSIPGAGPVRVLPTERSVQPATATITVTETNDPPTFDIVPTIDILEDSFGQTVGNVLTDVLPGPPTASDENAVQGVSFQIVDALSTVPAGLMMQPPAITPSGGLTFFPAPDAVGTAVYVIRATDDDPLDPRSTDGVVTVNVRPVNDAPRFDPNVAGTSDLDGPDDAYDVARIPSTGLITDGTITYTLREDNTQALGVLEPYFIPLNRELGVVGYNRVGLLDVFVAGPDNELDGTSGGNQVLELFSFPTQTKFGGQLSSVFSGGQLVGLNYVPPLNFNNQIDSNEQFDEFFYTVRDDSTVGGETWSLTAGALVPERLTTTNRILFDLNPVNDRPEFTASTNYIEASEDGDVVTIPNFAFNINAGPPNTAFDEVDTNNGQEVLFSVTSLGFPQNQSSQFFNKFPTITPQGTLSFEPAANVFGEFEFEVVLTDDGPGNATRGDLISSLPQTITIDIQPINDPPVVAPDAQPLSFTLLEDGTFDILVNGDTLTPGLLDVFLPGPDNETANIVPGGNQTVALTDPIPATTAHGGTLEEVRENGEIVRFVYRPRPDFVGMDSFIYTVTDDGVSVNVGTGGVVRPDARIAANTVELEVRAVNDTPQFSGAGNVVSDEDEGPVVVDNWATNVQAGPASAGDEAALQNLTFLITQISTNTELFAVAPVAVIDPDTGTATLNYTTASDARGVAVFEVRLRDDGPTDLAIGDDNLSDPHSFTIRVNAINDPPEFIAGGTVSVLEDSGPYNEQWATNVTPGPPDEASQSVRFEVTTPADARGLFQSLPEISDAGVLRFTPASNAVGVVDLTVQAIDSEGGATTSITLRIVIREDNDPPVAVDDDVNTDEDRLLTISAAQLLANDQDPDLFTNPFETLTVVMEPESFSVSGARVTYDALTGQITYDPSESVALQSLPVGQSLTDTFSYSIRDASGVLSAPATVRLNVTGINDAPSLGVDNPTLNPNGQTVIPVLANDSDVDSGSDDPQINDGDTIDPSSIVITLQPAFGSLDIDVDGVITYTPFGSFSTVDQFRYTVADDLGLRSEEALVTIAANAAPVTRSDFVGTFLDTAQDVIVAANDFDPDGPLTLTLSPLTSGASVNGSNFSINVEGTNETFLFTTDEDLVSNDNLIVVAPEHSAETVAFFTASKIAEVFPGALLAFSSGRVVSLGEQTGAVSVGVGTSGFALDGGLNLASVQIVRQPVRGEAIPQAGGIVLYVPEPGFNGEDSFQYTITDREGRVSEPTDVDVRVVKSRLQNPDESTDVNDDGNVTALDALLVINLLTREGLAEIPVETDDRGPNFYDVTGEQIITSRDALVVINELNRRDLLGQSEAEQLFADSGPVSETPPTVPLADLSTVSNELERIADASVPEVIDGDVIDLIAGSQSEDDDDLIEALDAALGDLI